jgi:uncharacterized membrane protein YhaH (DUF805 family)
MGLLNFLFGFNGRIGRLAYGIGTSVPLLLAIMLLLAFADFGPFMASLQAGQWPVISGSTMLICGVFISVTVVSCAALGAKRYHDLNTTGWMILAPVGLEALAAALLFVSPGIGFVASIGAYIFSFWQIIRLVFFSGSSGENTFGPPPNVMRDLAGGKVDVDMAEPDWVASAMKRTTAKAQVVAASTAATTPVTRVVRAPKLNPNPSLGSSSMGAAMPAGFGRRNR